MAVTRVFVSGVRLESQTATRPTDVAAGVVPLRADQAKHLVKVLRLSAGDPVVVVEKESEREFWGRLDLDGAAAQVRLEKLVGEGGPRAVVRTLVQALAKGERSDVIVEKATELGVSRILFFQSSRSVVRLSGSADIEKKQERFQRIAESAAEQSGKRFVLEVSLFTSLAGVLRVLPALQGGNDRLICASLVPEAIPLKSCTPHTAPAHLLIGPEGDLTPEETDAARQAGFHLVSLGPYVLRVETAAIAGVAMVEALREE